MPAKQKKPLVVAEGGHVTLGGKEYNAGEKLPGELTEEQREFLLKSKQVVDDEGNEEA